MLDINNYIFSWDGECCPTLFKNGESIIIPGNPNDKDYKITEDFIEKCKEHWEKTNNFPHGVASPQNDMVDFDEQQFLDDVCRYIRTGNKKWIKKYFK